MAPVAKTMRAVFIEKPGGPLVTKEVDVPVPGPGEVLIKMAAAPVNPSDLARIRNAYGEHDLHDLIPGLEGSGTVVKAGKGILPSIWLGKRVTCSSDRASSGTWAEYMVTSAGMCFSLDKSISFEQGSMSLVNPLTAIEFFKIIKERGHKALINNAAASSLGRMIEILGKKHGIPVINIVRRQDQADKLKALGSEHVIISTDQLFTDRLANLSASLSATILFDSVCDKNLKDMISALPSGSEVVIYGNLAQSDEILVSPRSLIDNNISVSGFYLGNKSKENGLIKNFINLLEVRRLMKHGLSINVRNNYPISKAQEAVDAYLLDMSAGKVVFIMPEG